MYPWLKFIVGAMHLRAGGKHRRMADFPLSKRQPCRSLFIWGQRQFFAWLVMALPLQIFPRLVSLFDPQTGGMLHYVYYPTFGSRFALAFGWILIFMLIAGILQSR